MIAAAAIAAAAIAGGVLYIWSNFFFTSSEAL